MAATVHQLNPRTQTILSEKDLEAMVAIQQKRAEGKTLSEADKQTLGRFADMVVDTMEIPENNALRNIMRRFMTNGEISLKEQAQLREALGEIPDIKENPKLTAHLKMLRAKGTATDAEIDMIPKLAGKLSIVEDDAVYATLASLAIARGISEPAAQKIQTWLERARVDREKYSNKQGFYGQMKRIGLIALTLAGIMTLFAFNPFAGLGAAGALTAQMGITIGAMFGVNKGAEFVTKGNKERIMNYGVND